jgi:nitroimidazol reductase NimA-like FMN-containing flavoprotein (pyridoxamine 5'-phosphate oxidase superfamily)
MLDYTTATPTAHQRRPEYRRGEEWIRSILEKAPIGHVAHFAHGQPYVTPTNFWYDEAGGRIIFHSNVAGRLRANLEACARVCLEVSEMGRFLPSNAALEFSVQYRSVMVFGTVRILKDPDDIRAGLHAMLAKYFPGLRPGFEFRPVTEKEIARTSVYSLAIESWSGKENWAERADMVADWPPLTEELL